MLALIQKKAQWLENSIPNSVLHLIEPVIHEASQSATLPRAIASYLTADLVYALLRNRLFLKAPLFSETLLDYLVSDYGIDNQSGRRIVGEAIGSLETQLGPFQNRFTSDFDYLRYAYLRYREATNIEQASFYLGVGDHLIKRFVDSEDFLRKLDQEKSDQPTAHFLPAIDKKIIQLICDFREVCDPGYFFKTKMYYEIAPIMSEEETSSVLDALVDIAFSENLKTELAVQTAPLSPEVVANLTKSDLLYQSSNGDGPFLTPKGYAYIALPIATLFKNQNNKLSDLHGASEAFQIAVLSHISAEDHESIYEWFTENYRYIKPKAFAVGMSHLRQSTPPGALAHLLSKVIKRSKNPWLRKASCELLNNLDIEAEQIRQILRSVAECDASNAVKDQALEILATRSITSEASGVSRKVEGTRTVP